MPRQFVNPAPVLHDILGIDPAFNGSLTFYEIGTTTPKDTWSDYDQNILNENPVPLDSAARSSTQIWGEGEYTIVLRNADGETVWTRDWRPEQAGSDALPAKESGKFLTTDGESWLLDSITQVPDPTGFSGRILSTDGANLLWVTPASIVPEPPEPPVYPIGPEGNGFRIGDLLLQFGTGSWPATGQTSASQNITFPEEYDSVMWAQAVPTQGTTTNNSVPTNLIPSTESLSNTGFTAAVQTNGAMVSGSRGHILTATTFRWFAIGIKAMPEP